MWLAKWITIRVMDTKYKASFSLLEVQTFSEALLAAATKKKHPNPNSKESWVLKDSAPHGNVSTVPWRCSCGPETINRGACPQGDSSPVQT